MKDILKSLSFAKYLSFHPFNGFWDLKHEKIGTVKSSIIIVALLAGVFILENLATGFIFNRTDIRKVNILLDIVGVIIPFILWCVSNWCFTTLMEGEGTFRDIVITSAYALVPLLVMKFLLIIFSNLITVEDAMFYSFFQSLALIWSGGLLFFGTMVVHQYSLGKTFITCILIIIGIAIMLFIGVMFFTVIDQMLNFILTIYKEIIYRR